MEAFGQNFRDQILTQSKPNLHILNSPESKKVVFENWSLHMYLCVCVTCVCVYACDCVENIPCFISPKLMKIETPNFMHRTRLAYK